MVIIESCELYLPIPHLLVDILILKYSHFQNITTWVKCTLSIVYNKFSQTALTHQMMVFESWITIVIK